MYILYLLPVLSIVLYPDILIEVFSSGLGESELVSESFIILVLYISAVFLYRYLYPVFFIGFVLQTIHITTRSKVACVLCILTDLIIIGTAFMMYNEAVFEFYPLFLGIPALISLVMNVLSLRREK